MGVTLLVGDYCILIKNTCKKVNIGINQSLVGLKITLKWENIKVNRFAGDYSYSSNKYRKFSVCIQYRRGLPF